uniref:Uncharacterized protein n=1 Tax=Hucho hucho TaxID=62062 RepID=A0A4W5KUF4_9TELE
MPPGVVAPSPRSSPGRCFYALTPYFIKDFSRSKIDQLISESFLTVKGAALFLPRGNGSSPTSASRFSQLRSKHAGDLQQHLQTMFTLLRPEDNIKLVRVHTHTHLHDQNTNIVLFRAIIKIWFSHFLSFALSVLPSFALSVLLSFALCNSLLSLGCPVGEYLVPGDSLHGGGLH